MLWAVLAWARRTLFNEAPSIGNDPTTNSQVDGVVTGDLNVVDADGDPLSYQIIQGPQNGTVVVTPDGTFAYTPNADLAETGGEDSFTVKVHDTGFHLHNFLLGFFQPDWGHSNTQVVTVSVEAVNAVNDAPLADPDAITRVSGDPSIGVVTGSLGITDAGEDQLRYTVTSAPTSGTVTVDERTGTYTYTPTVTARILAGLRSDAVTDAFAVSATDGVNTPVSVTVQDIPVAPAHLTSGQTFTTGDHPGGMAVSADTLYVADYVDNTVTAVNIDTGARSTIAVGTQPTFMAVSGDRLYVAGASITIIDIDPTSPNFNTVVGAPIAVASGTTGIAVSGSRLYVSNPQNGTVSVVDLTSRSVTDTIPVGTLPLSLAAVNDRIYVGDQSVSIIDANPASATYNTVIGHAGQLPGFAYRAAASPDGKRVYFVGQTNADPTNRDGFLVVVDTATNTVTPIDLAGPSPGTGFGLASSVAVSPDGALAYVVDSDRETVSVIDTATSRIIDTIQYTPHPTAGANLMVISPDGTGLYISDAADHGVSSLSLVAGPAPVPVITAVVNTQNVDHVTGTVTIDVTGSRSDGNPVDVQYTPPANGTIDVVDNGNGTYAVTYTPYDQARYDAFDSPGTDTDHFIAYTTDGQRFDVVDIAVPIDPKQRVNQPPEWTAGYELTPDYYTGVRSGYVFASDPDNDPLTYSLETPPDPSLGTVTVDSANRTWTFTPTVDVRVAAWMLSEQQPVSFSIAVSDGIHSTSTLVNTTVDPVPVVDIVRLLNPGSYAISPDSDRVYVAARSEKKIAVIDTNSNTVVDTIDLDFQPASLTLSPDGKTLYMQRQQQGSVEPGPETGLFLAAVDTTDYHVKFDSIYLSGFSNTGRVVVSPDGNTVLVLRGLGYSSSVIDIPSLSAVPARLPDASAVAFSPDGRVYLAVPATDYPSDIGDSVVIYSPRGNTMLSSPIAIDGQPTDIAVSPLGDRIYVVSGTGRADSPGILTIIDPYTNATLNEIPIAGAQRHTLTISPDGKQLYVASLANPVGQDYGNGVITVFDIDPAGGITGPPVDIPVGIKPQLVVSADSTRLYVLNTGQYDSYSDNVMVIDTATKTLVAQPFYVGSGYIFNEPTIGINDSVDMQLSADGNRLYIENLFHGLVVVDTGAFNIGGDHTYQQVAPNSTAWRYDHLRDVTDNEHGIYIEKVHGTDNVDRLIAYIGGTTADFIGPNQSWIENIPEEIGVLDGDITAVLDRAVADNPDAPILLVGYSQGGIDAQNIAASGHYNVTTVLTFGTAVTTLLSPPGHVIHIIDSYDPVSYHFSDSFALDDNDDAHAIYMAHGGVEPADPDATFLGFRIGYVNVHTNRLTYENLGIAFDTLPGHDFDSVKADLADFTGSIADDHWE